MTKSVAILGCGPAGLMAAHAAALSGWNFHIYSKRVKSPLYGAQYLHQAIPELPCDGPSLVSYRLNGTPQQYRRKVYGETWDGTTSPEDFMDEHYAWDLRAAYEYMWNVYGGEIEHFELSTIRYPNVVFALYDAVISTVPRTIWDDRNEHFERSYVWALGDTELPRVEHSYRPEPFSVQCDGRPHVQWYRVSNIFGYCTMEWPQWWNQPYASVTPPVPGASLVTKPLRYTGCAAQDFTHLGRYAQWEKGVLTSDVFFDAMKVLANDSM